MAGAEITNNGLEKRVTRKLFAHAAMFGLMFGFDIGITGCLTSNSNFLSTEFPSVYKNLMSRSTATYFDCKVFDDVVLTMYRSCLYLTAFVSSSLFSILPDFMYKKAYLGAGFLFYGTVLSLGGAYITDTFFAGRIMSGIGLGALIMLMTTHLWELDGGRNRSQLLMCFQLAVSVGILTANLVHYLVRNPNDVNNNWRIGVFFYALLPCIQLLVLLLLFKCGFPSDSEIVRISLTSIIFERKYKPQLFLVTFIPVFQQLAGLSAFVFYAPIFFKTIGLGESGSRICSIATWSVNCLVTVVSFVSSDKFGRRTLLIQGATLMLICQIIIASIIGVRGNSSIMPKWNAFLLAVAWCGYVAGFAWSWGPFGWFVPDRLLPSEIRLAGHNISINMNMLSMFFVTQFFTKGLCEIKFFMHLIILGTVLLMTVFVYILLPETKDVPMQEMSQVWRKHTYWKKYYVDEEDIRHQGNILVSTFV